MSSLSMPHYSLTNHRCMFAQNNLVSEKDHSVVSMFSAVAPVLSAVDYSAETCMAVGKLIQAD